MFFYSGIGFNGYDMAKRLHGILKIGRSLSMVHFADRWFCHSMSGFQGAKETEWGETLNGRMDTEPITAVYFWVKSEKGGN